MGRPSPFRNLRHGPEPDAVVIDYERWRVRKAWTLTLLGLVATLYALPVGMGTGHTPAQNAIAFAVALVGVPTAAVGIVITPVLALGARQRRIGLGIDAQGIWYRNSHTHQMAMVPWSDIAGVGLCGTHGSGKPLKPPLAIDLFPANGQVPGTLRMNLVDSAPVAPSLPTQRIRIPLPGWSSVQPHIEAAVTRFAPQRWVAPYDAYRPTGGSPFSGLVCGPGPGAVVLSFRTATVKAVLRMAVPFLLGVGALGYVYFPSVFAAGGHVTTVGKVIAALIAGPLLGIAAVGVLIAVRAVRRGNGIAFDTVGVWRRDARFDVLVVMPWSDIAGVGVAGARTRTWSLIPGDNSRVMTYLDLFPSTKETVDLYPQLRPALIRDKPVRPGLSGTHYRIPLPQFTGSSKKVHEAVNQFAPQLWVGDYDIGRISPITSSTPPNR
ncbi:MAG: hypothetical protein JO285_06575 [Kutzneria sp.]|nr:hypothetical protein [Kutzneria sp.]